MILSKATLFWVGKEPMPIWPDVIAYPKNVSFLMTTVGGFLVLAGKFPQISDERQRVLLWNGRGDGTDFGDWIHLGIDADLRNPQFGRTIEDWIMEQML